MVVALAIVRSVAALLFFGFWFFRRKLVLKVVPLVSLPVSVSDAVKTTEMIIIAVMPSRPDLLRLLDLISERLR